MFVIVTEMDTWVVKPDDSESTYFAVGHSAAKVSFEVTDMVGSPHCQSL